MKKIKRLTILALILISNVLVAQNLLTPEQLWTLKRVSGTAVSPDGKWIVFGITSTDIEANTSNRDLYLVPVKGGSVTQLTSTPASEYNEIWRPDGLKIGFLSMDNGSPQFYEINPDGSGLRQVTDIEGGIGNVDYSPYMHYLSFTHEVKNALTTQDIYPDLPKAQGKIITDLSYRHWDVWEDEYYSHVFYTKYSDGSISDYITDIMETEPYDVPLKPFDGKENICWSPDERMIAYTCKKSTGTEYAISTNSDIYLYELKPGVTHDISAGMMGYDKNPSFSSDGFYLMWSSMEHSGFESDRNRVMLMDMASRKIKEVSIGLDRNVNNPTWSDDGKLIYFISGVEATYQLFELNPKDGSIRQISKGVHDYTAFEQAGKLFVTNRMSMSHPNELYTVDIKNGSAKQLDFANEEKIKAITWGKVESRWIPTTDGKQEKVWIIYPPDFDASKKYPTLLYCQGGPQSAVSQFFSIRWNFQMMAAKGYIVVAPNRRGLPSFGRDWNDEISKDWGGQAMKDYLSAIDALTLEPYVDENRLGAVGASFGGYSIYWLAGNHEKRFKAFIAHDGVFNLESMYGTTEELFFVNWDLGGPYWDKSMKARYDKFSPHRYVQNWDTPIMIIHGQNDYRVDISEGLQAFTAAKAQGIPARFLYMPNENHWVLHPQNGILWQREFFGWLDKWLK